MNFRAEKICRYSASANDFTLIEMLVTLAVFGLALAALLTGLWIGGRTADRIENDSALLDETRAAQKQFNEDVACSFLEEDNDRFKFAQDLDGNILLDFYSLARSSTSSLPGKLSHIQYEKDSNPDGTLQLVRKEAAVAADEPVENYDSAVLLDNLSEIEIDFWDGAKWKDRWDKKDKFPVAARISAMRKVKGRKRHVILVSRPRAAGWVVENDN